jgi:hypothetical protein
MLMVGLRMSDGQQLRVRLSDISKGGAKIRSPIAIAKGAAITLELPVLGWVPATVAWVGAGVFGLQFAGEVDPSAARQAISGNFAQPRAAPPPRAAPIL